MKYIHVTVCILSPTLDLSAVGQDELLKRVYAQFTIQSPCFLHLDGFVAMLLVGIYPKKYLKKKTNVMSVVFMHQKFCCQPHYD